MSRRYESPKNLRKTNPMEYQDYENVKERHYLGKYRPEDDVETDFRDNNDFDNYPETSAFGFVNYDNGNNLKEVPKFEDCDMKGILQLKSAIKSLLIKS